MIAALAALAFVAPSEAWVVVPAAELQAGYDQLWAVSDVHGHRNELERLLSSAGAVPHRPPIVDFGLKERSSKGMLLRCEVADALRHGLGSCRALLPDGALTALPEVSLR